MNFGKLLIVAALPLALTISGCETPSEGKSSIAYKAAMKAQKAAKRASVAASSAAIAANSAASSAAAAARAAARHGAEPAAEDGQRARVLQGREHDCLDDGLQEAGVVNAVSSCSLAVWFDRCAR